MIRGQAKNETLEQIRARFEDLTVPEPNTGCTFWLGWYDYNGYGRFSCMSLAIAARRKGRSLGAHNVAWELEHGPIPAGMAVLHNCDQPACVNVRHLRLGTQRENIQDRQARHRQARGESQALAKLTQVQVDSIRREYIPRVVSMRMLARKYDVTSGTISAVLTGRTWNQ